MTEASKLATIKHLKDPKENAWGGIDCMVKLEGFGDEWFPHTLDEELRPALVELVKSGKYGEVIPMTEKDKEHFFNEREYYLNLDKLVELDDRMKRPVGELALAAALGETNEEALTVLKSLQAEKEKLRARQEELKAVI